MNYDIVGLCPRSDLSIGAWGFSIKLYPEFKNQVSQSELTADNARETISKLGRSWLDGCGFEEKYEIDGEEKWLYTPNQDLRVSWGEWGLEHITVPGNACGLDITGGIGAPIGGGKCLAPHNIDSMRQTMLLLVVFTWFTESIGILADGK